MDIDIRVHGGTVHTPGGPVKADVMVSGERIVALVDPADNTPSKNQIDASGKHVIPGLVDLHAHTRVPGYEYKEDYLTSSQAAAVGGITTYADMPNVEPPTTDVELFEEKRGIASSQCVIDFGHLVSPMKVDEIAKLAAAGATGFKIFQVSGGYPHDPRLAQGDSEHIFAAFQEIAKTGLHTSIHPYNQPLMDKISEQTLAAGAPHDITTFSKMYVNDVVWRSAVAMLLELQRETGVRMHLLHTHAAGSLRLIEQAKRSGQRLTCAVDLKYYQLTKQDAAEQGARCAPGGVITEDPERLALIWQSLNNGVIDIVDTDHAPHSLEDLEIFTKDPWHGPFGSPQYEYILSVTLNDVNAGRLGFETAIKLLSENSARLMGRYPQKGAIQVGSDADLVVVDMGKEIVARDEDTYTKVHWTPYKGRKLKGAPTLTMLRGTVIAKNGKVTAKPGFGRYLEGVPQKPVGSRNWYSIGLAYEPVA